MAHSLPPHRLRCLLFRSNYCHFHLNPFLGRPLVVTVGEEDVRSLSGVCLRSTDEVPTPQALGLLSRWRLSLGDSCSVSQGGLGWLLEQVPPLNLFSPHANVRVNAVP